MKIGVFDSGFGGLSVLRGIVEMLPEYSYLYLGDTARVPYGSRSPEIVFEFTRQAVDFLLDEGCRLVILACNTASSDALRKIQQEYLPKHLPDRKVLGVLIPTAEEAVERTRNGRIGVLATMGTVRSGAYLREISKIRPDATIIQSACPLLVPLIEAGETGTPATEYFLEKYLAPIIEADVDTVVLGCTHYGLIEDGIRSKLGRDVAIVSGARAVPSRLRDYLDRHPDIDASLARDGGRRFCSTDCSNGFGALGSRFYGSEVDVEAVDL